MEGKQKMTTGYCVKCRSKREMKSINEVINKRGMKMAKGICPTCGTKMCRILGKA